MLCNNCSINTTCSDTGVLAPVVDKVLDGQEDPYTASEKLLASVLGA